MRWAIWYHLYNLKNVINTHRGVLVLVVKLQAKAFWWLHCKILKVWPFFNIMHERFKALFFIQKEPSEVFRNKKCSQNFRKFYRKYLCWSVFNLVKRDFNSGVFYELCQFFKNTYFEQHLWTTASVYIYRDIIKTNTTNIHEVKSKIYPSSQLLQFIKWVL